MNTPARDQAWKMVRIVSEEAYNRYNLVVPGTVIPIRGNVYTLKFSAWIGEEGVWFSQSMTREFLLDVPDLNLVAASVFDPVLRIVAEGRDLRLEAGEIMERIELWRQYPMEKHGN